MARLSNESKKRVVTLHLKGHSVIEIRRRLLQENISISRQSLYKLISKFHMGTLTGDAEPRRRKRKITKEMETVIEEALRNNDEITSRGIKRSNTTLLIFTY